jgi:hypothetical protein
MHKKVKKLKISNLKFLETFRILACLIQSMLTCTFCSYNRHLGYKACSLIHFSCKTSYLTNTSHKYFSFIKAKAL